MTVSSLLLLTTLFLPSTSKDDSMTLLDSPQVHVGAAPSQVFRRWGNTPPVPSNDHLLAPEIAGDITRWERHLPNFLAGRLTDDQFRAIRLSTGVYGQRQGGTNQMIRVKLPYGGVTPEQFEAMAYVADTYSRGWGHITTRQNIQFHFVDLHQVAEVLRVLGHAGITTREACGDTIRNVMGCQLAGACPYEAIDISPWAEATYRYFVRNPIGQRLPRKFKINFSGCATDCGQAMFNDVGVVGTTRTAADGSVETGFRVFIAGGLGANPHPALALEEFTSREDLLPTIEAALRVFDQAGNRDNRIRARMKWLVDTLGIDEVRRRITKQRSTLVASATWPGGIPAEVLAAGDAPAGRAVDSEPTPIGHGVSVTLRSNDPYARWESTNVVRGTANGTVSAYAWAHMGDLTSAQMRALADVQRALGATVRFTARQNLVFRGLTNEQLPDLYNALDAIDMAQPGAELIRDVVACPGADTCNLAITQSRGLARAIGGRLEEEGLAEVGGLRINISGCMNSCGQHHIADIGLFGQERRVGSRTVPGYQLLLGGHLGDEQVHFGDRSIRLIAKNAPDAVIDVVRRFTGERTAGESFRSWMDRVGGAKAIGDTLKRFDVASTDGLDDSDTPQWAVDFDETAPFVVALGESECR
jgi:sulfite reductase (ferredoxin)